MKNKSFSPKLDMKSENMLYALSLNSRINLSELSKMLNEKRRVVENRYLKLFDNKYIKPLLSLNYHDQSKSTILIKLKYFDKPTIEGISKLSKVLKLKETIGEYDLSILVASKNKRDLDKILNEINTLLHGRIQNISVIKHDFEDTLGNKAFCHNINLKSNFKSHFRDSSYVLKKEEEKIVKVLRFDPLISYKDLSLKLGWSYTKIKAMINHLEKEKVIRFTIDPNYYKLGLEFHNVLFRINLGNRKEFESNMIKYKNAHWIKRGTGSWDYIVSIATRDIDELIDIVRDIRTKNKNYILDCTTLISKIHVRRKG